MYLRLEINFIVTEDSVSTSLASRARAYERLYRRFSRLSGRLSSHVLNGTPSCRRAAPRTGHFAGGRPESTPQTQTTLAGRSGLGSQTDQWRELNRSRF